MVQLTDDGQIQPLIWKHPIAPIPASVWKEKLRKAHESDVFGCIIELKDTGEFMGCASLKIPEPKNRDGLFSIVLALKFCNSGYGSEAMKFIVDHAFRWYGLHRVSLDTFGNNTRAIAAYEKLGFVEEGRGREAIWLDNKWVDGVSMGVLRREWAEKYWKSESGKDA
ncbi:acyl-CoA N-acyltransferase [Coniophora puteana RWD-64-598 SS2]|uniref:Acyl-CoA N-acyltransferase n=1 Tax=Coniophora puteana (strain RWD-64-598) TaxID=741705 RepID=A0A5M3MRV4_CONPW|nr:acyl-CoA N-acyltransferase [Coniophora puteana RWD-64-598 SS2]EIW81385.1 acyl-CoA N-acyltransferase [Coniophora puteana RWD-64-598 SS2]